MHIPKLSDIGKKVLYKCRNEKDYFRTYDKIKLDNAHKLLNSIPKNLSLDAQNDNETIYHFEDNNTEIVTNRFYLMPNKKKVLLRIKNNDRKAFKLVESWLKKLKLAKYFFNLDGVPYDWISNSGKLNIHRKARDTYLQEYEENLKAEKLIQDTKKCLTLEKLKKIKIPSSK